jgi:hypothetical protein
MDKATIDAMRVVVEGCEDRAKAAEGSKASRVFLGEQTILTPTFRAAVEGLRSLVDQAAQRVEGEAVDDEGRRAIAHVARYLKLAADSAVRHDESHVFIKAECDSYGVFPSTIFAAVRAVEALLAAQPAKPEPDELTLEECVAAINRKPDGRVGIKGWKIRVEAKGLETKIRLSLKEVKAMGRLLIERERAAKGGAA